MGQAVQSAPRRVSFYTVGCRLNQAETAVLVDRLKGDGFTIVEFGHPTDLLVLNTCSVTDSAEADCRYAIRRTLRQSPAAFVAVIGCYAQTGSEALQSVPGIDLILGQQYKMHLPEYLRRLPRLTKGTTAHVLQARKREHGVFEMEGTGDYQTTRANLKIQDGCNFMCSFCLIPSARGRERSRRLENALREAEDLVARGHRELVLTGVNIGRFSEDGATLVHLIQRLEMIAGLERIRISSIEPTTIPDELVDYMATSRKLCRFLHVPLQSGDDEILQAMNRRYSVREYTEWVEWAVRRIPNVCLGTDLMVGFPGEGEAHFANTQSVVSDLPFAYFHVFSYSPRPGTAAIRMGNPVAPSIMKRRNRTLTGLSRVKRQTYYQRFIGQPVSVLFETQDREGLWMGLTDNFVKVKVSSPHNLSNQLKEVVVTGLLEGMAVGEVVGKAGVRERGKSLPVLGPQVCEMENGRTVVSADPRHLVGTPTH